MRLLSYLFVAFALLAAPAHAAVDWTEPQSFGTNAASHVAAAVGADGTTAVVWTEVSKNGSTAWLSVDRGAPVRLGGDEDWTDVLPAVTVTPRGDVIAVWDRVIAHGRSGLGYYRNGVQDWLPVGGHAAQLASDAAGNVTVAWRPGSVDDGEPTLYAATIAASGTVSAAQAVTTDRLGDFTLAVAPDGTAALGWWEGQRGVAFRDGTSFGTAIALPAEAPLVPETLMLAVDPAGTFFVAGEDADPNGHLGSVLMVTSRAPGGMLRPVQHLADGDLTARNLVASPAGGALLACMCYDGETTALCGRARSAPTAPSGRSPTRPTGPGRCSGSRSAPTARSSPTAAPIPTRG